MSATAGAAEHGLAQQTTTSQQLEWVSKLGEKTAKIDSSGYHSGSDRVSNSVRRVVMPDSGEAISHEYTPADKREDQDWADATVAVKCLKCGKTRMTEPVEGKAMAAVATRDAGKTPLTVENVQEAVVKALTTQAPTAAVFAGRHEFERGNRFGLGKHNAFGAITEGATADEASPEGMGAGEDNDSGPRRRPRRGPTQAATIMNWLLWFSVGMGLLSILIMVLAQLMAYVGDLETDVVSSFRWAAAKTLGGAGYAGTFACAAKMLLFITVLTLPPADAYSVAGIGNRAQAPAIYSAMHLKVRAKLDPAVWAPVENTFGGELNGSQPAQWAWGEVRGYASHVMQQLAGRAPMGTAVSQREMEYCIQADSGMATSRYFVDSCCSKTMVRDRHLLKNVRPLTMPARVARLSGIKTMNQQADLHLPVTDVNGKQTVIILEGVYYYPDVKYNLVSVVELAGLNYESRFNKQASSVRGAAGIVPLIHT